MITPEYCQTMARYNAWQNDGLCQMLPNMDPDALYLDRGAFFGSIMRTVNHVMWGDQLWISRFDGGESPDLSGQEGLEMMPTAAAWAEARVRLDARITLWANSVAAVDLEGDLTWYSGMLGRELCKPIALCVMQVFNHQTHHRGQVHAMLTAAGQTPQATDLPFIPEDA